jgi:hypothetical protein
MIHECRVWFEPGRQLKLVRELGLPFDNDVVVPYHDLTGIGFAPDDAPPTFFCQMCQVRFALLHRLFVRMCVRS